MNKKWSPYTFHARDTESKITISNVLQDKICIIKVNQINVQLRKCKWVVKIKNILWDEDIIKKKGFYSNFTMNSLS